MSGENNNTGNAYSLKMLLEKYFFIIPEYQRDYAQGRDNERDARVLDMFVKEIYEVLSSGPVEEYTLHLDYVYGDIEEKNGVEFFFPVDGQQRLTTLFLFYTCCYQTVSDENEKSFLFNLKYNIRPTSNKLINCLIRNGFKEPDSTSPDWKHWIDLYSEISRDPTAEALLKAYRKIEKVLSTGRQESYMDKLEKITFEVVETNKHKLPRTVFWKMNARGRALTQSEVFKAAFFSRSEFSRTFDDFENKLFSLITGADNDYQIVEKTLMNIVKIIFEGFKEIRYPVNSHEGFDFWGSAYISKDEYLNYQVEREEEVNQIFSALQKPCNPFDLFDMSLPEYVKRKRADGILNSLVKVKNRDRDLPQNIRALFYSYLIALPLESEPLKDWMRVCSNLIWNSSDVAYALKIISKLKGHASCILEFLAADKGVESDFNLGNEGEIETNLRQYKEEKAKAKRIQSNEVEKDEIFRAESTAFADGRIDFLFFDDSWKHFADRLNSFQTWFDENGVKKNLRVAVAKAYIKLSTLEWGQNYFFDASREYWKTEVFSKVNADDNTKRFVSELLSVTNEDDLNKIGVDETDTFSLEVKKSLVENEWFIKWMFQLENKEGAKYSLKWPYGNPCFHKYYSSNAFYWDAGGWLNTRFFVKMHDKGVSLDDGYYFLIDDAGNSASDFSSSHLVILGEWYSGVNYTRFKYQNNTFYLISTGMIITADEYKNNEWNKVGEERSIYYVNDRHERFLKTEDELNTILSNICTK